MADLGSYIERTEENKIINLIDKKGETTGYPRHYIGLSGLGSECKRALWYTFRWFTKSKIPGRTNRIFNVGHAAEEIMVKDLRSIGVECWNVLEDQDEFIDAHGYAKGHPDGYAKNIPGSEKTVHLLEFKTANDKSFKHMQKHKVEKSKPVYYAQMILYMYKAKLTRALFMMVNKNDSTYYTERVHADNTYAKDLLRAAEDIVFSEDFNDFKRIGNNSPQWFACKWCNHNEVCFEKAEPLKNCRTCNNCDLIGDGQFLCSKTQKLLEVKEQEKGCDKHEFLDCIK